MRFPRNLNTKLDHFFMYHQNHVLAFLVKYSTLPDVHHHPIITNQRRGRRFFIPKNRSQLTCINSPETFGVNQTTCLSTDKIREMCPITYNLSVNLCVSVELKRCRLINITNVSGLESDRQIARGGLL